MGTVVTHQVGATVTHNWSIMTQCVPTLGLKKTIAIPCLMAGRNLKRAFNRLFVVLSALWAPYWCVVYPIQEHNSLQQFAIDRGVRRDSDCLQQPNASTVDVENCQQASDAETEKDVSDISLMSEYHESWSYLAIFAFLVPFVSYGVIRGLTAAFRETSLWIWRGYKNE